MKIKAGNYCPLLQKECIGLQCAWITQIRGMDPQTGEDVDEWDCAIKWLPVLLIENTKKYIELIYLGTQIMQEEYTEMG